MKVITPIAHSLLPFQLKAVKEMVLFLKHNGGVYNCSDMGLGKTVQTVTTLNTLGCKKVLIVCPAVMKGTWKAEVKKWSTLGLTTRVADKAVDIDKTTFNYLIISYNLLINVEKLRAHKWDAIVLDEAHYVKSYKAKRTKEILKHYWPKAKYKIALSGTPFTQSVMDGYSLFSKFNPVAFPSYIDFANKYANARVTPWGTQYYGVKNHDELSKIIRSTFYIRYRKEEVLTELPDKQFTRISLPESYALKDTPEEVLAQKEYIELLRQAFASKVPYFPKPPESIMKKKRLQGEKKTGPIIEFILELLEQNIPVVCFGYHLSVIAELEKKLSKYEPSVITGSVGSNDRTERVRRFQDGETDLFIGQLSAAGVGITLTRSSVCVLSELDYSPSVIAQAVDRLHRIGQKDTVNVYYFVVENSLEEDIIEIVMDKAKSFAKVLDA